MLGIVLFPRWLDGYYQFLRTRVAAQTKRIWVKFVIGRPI